MAHAAIAEAASSAAEISMDACIPAMNEPDKSAPNNATASAPPSACSR
jgi:hypothetical protein